MIVRLPSSRDCRRYRYALRMDIQSYVNIAKLVHDLPPRFGSVFKVFFQPLNITHVSEAGQVNPSCLQWRDDVGASTAREERDRNTSDRSTPYSA